MFLTKYLKILFKNLVNNINNHLLITNSNILITRILNT